MKLIHLLSLNSKPIAFLVFTSVLDWFAGSVIAGLMVGIMLIALAHFLF